MKTCDHFCSCFRCAPRVDLELRSAQKGNKEIGFQGFYNQIIAEGESLGVLLAIGNLGYYVTREIRGTRRWVAT